MARFLALGLILSALLRVIGLRLTPRSPDCAAPVDRSTRVWRRSESDRSPRAETVLLPLDIDECHAPVEESALVPKTGPASATTIGR
jgi:hypothetical protein